MSERRFTDREVAKILQRAVQLDGEEAGPGTARGLTVPELQEIGREVGISREVIARAASELVGTGGAGARSLLGGPQAHRETRIVPRELTREQLADLVRVIDERALRQGTVTEALSNIRWSSPGRHLSRQVVLEPGNGETLIRVEERRSTRIERVVRWLPTGYAGLISWLMATEGGQIITGSSFAIAAAAALAVWLVASTLLGMASKKSRERVRALAEELSLVASAELDDEDT